jgi:hypothetical protein
MMPCLRSHALFAFPCGATAANHMAVAILNIMSALRFFLCTAKCQFVPARQGKFLGLTVNVAKTRFGIPQDKLEYILGFIQRALDAPRVTQRQLAQIAGLLVSIKPAVYMAALYTRTLFQAITGHWDNEVKGQDLGLARRGLLFWYENLGQLQGKSWTPRVVIHRVCGDASATAYAGSSSLLSAPVVVGHTPAEQERMKSQKLSSCFRETKNAWLCITAMFSERPEEVRGSLIVYTGDNQGSNHCLNNISGNAEGFEEVKLLHIQAAKLEVLLEFQWQPRTTAELKYADMLSRTQYASQISLSNKAFRMVCSQKGWGFPSVDVFAGPVHEEHKASQLYQVCM